MSPRAVCAILEELVTTTHWPVYSPFAKLHYGKGKAEGLEEGRTEGLIEGERRARIADCTDLKQLKDWVRSAVTAASTSDLFARNPAASLPEGKALGQV
jgi:hypothetical protein